MPAYIAIICHDPSSIARHGIHALLIWPDKLLGEI